MLSGITNNIDDFIMKPQDCVKMILPTPPQQNKSSSSAKVVLNAATMVLFIIFYDNY